MAMTGAKTESHAYERVEDSVWGGGQSQRNNSVSETEIKVRIEHEY